MTYKIHYILSLQLSIIKCNLVNFTDSHWEISQTQGWKQLKPFSPSKLFSFQNKSNQYIYIYIYITKYLMQESMRFCHMTHNMKRIKIFLSHIKDKNKFKNSDSFCYVCSTRGRGNKWCNWSWTLEVAKDKAEQLKINASSVVFELIDSFVFELGCCH